MISNTTIGNPGTTLSCVIFMSAVAGQGAGVRRTVVLADGHAARVRRVDEWAAPFATIVPMSAALAAKQPQTCVPQPPHERSP